MAAVAEEEKNRKRRKTRARQVALAPISECSQRGDLPAASHSRAWRSINWWHLARLHVHTAGSRSPGGEMQRLESTVAHRGSERLQMIKAEQQRGAGAHVACEAPCLLNRRSAPPHGQLMPPQAQGCTRSRQSPHPSFIHFTRLICPAAIAPVPPDTHPPGAIK